MVTCGHQFRTGDECDWLICSSAVCPVNANSTATNILKKLIESHCRVSSGEPDASKSRSSSLSLDYGDDAGGGEAVKTADAGKRAGSFDENQHLDGCPFKWYYRKRTKTGWGPCLALKRVTEDKCRMSRSDKKFRDRIPLEVKIGKISLNKREPFVDCRNLAGRKPDDPERYKQFEIDPKVVEMQKKRLAEKLNYRPFRESEENDSVMSCDGNLGDGYLRPRSALGGKSPVSILLYPYNQPNWCSCNGVPHATGKAARKKSQRTSSATPPSKPSETAAASSSAQRPTTNPRPRTVQPSRSKSTKPQRNGKSLQLPKANVSFDGPGTAATGSQRPGPVARRRSDRAARQSSRSRGIADGDPHSLTALYYELEDKTNGGKRADDEDYLERMIRELSMEENLRGVRAVLNPGRGKRRGAGGNRSGTAAACPGSEEHFRVICKKVKLTRRTRTKSDVGR